MLKKVYGRKLSRGRGARQALFRSLMRSLVKHGQIVTTKAKAKAIQGEIDKLINLGLKNTLVSRRSVIARLGNDTETAFMLFEKHLPLVAKRNSGFTRAVNLPKRKGDLAKIVRLEFVDKPLSASEKKKKEEEKEVKEKETKTKKGEKKVAAKKK